MAAVGPIVVGALTARYPVEGGIHRYSGEMLSQLLAISPGAVGLVSAPELATADNRVRAVAPPVLARGSFSGNALRLLWNQSALPRLLRREGAALFYATAPEGMLRPPCPQIITVHDIIPLLFPQSAPRLAYYYRHILPRILRRCSGVVVMSAASGADVITHYSVPPERVHVVHQGFRSEVFQPGEQEGDAQSRRRHIGGPYLLAMADERPYKNVPRLIDAFARLREPNLVLALVGRSGQSGRLLRELAMREGVAGRVRFLGFVPDRELAALYRGAEAFVFPSLYEGFGLPPLEAMACGCPVVLSDRASLPEVGGDAAVYVDPEDADSIRRGVERVLRDPALRQRLSEAGCERARAFSYPRAATRLMEVLQACTSDALRVA